MSGFFRFRGLGGIGCSWRNGAVSRHPSSICYGTNAGVRANSNNSSSSSRCISTAGGSSGSSRSNSDSSTKNTTTSDSTTCQGGRRSHKPDVAVADVAANVDADKDPVVNGSHWMGVPRRLVIGAVHGFAYTYMNTLNDMRVRNEEVLQALVHDRPRGTPLITVSNHMSTLDDPLLWGQRGLRSSEPRHMRWTLTAKDICFTGPVLSYLFRLGKCIPLDREGTVHQPGMDEAVQRMQAGEWVHIFPEGRIVQEHAPISRLKWGLASLLDRLHTATNASVGGCASSGDGSSSVGGSRSSSSGGNTRGSCATATATATSRSTSSGASAGVLHDVQDQQQKQQQKQKQGGLLPQQQHEKQPILLCVGHSGLEKVMPQKYMWGRRPLVPLWGKAVSVVVGQPFTIDIASLRRQAQQAVAAEPEPALAGVLAAATSHQTPDSCDVVSSSLSTSDPSGQLPAWFGADALLNSPSVLMAKLEHELQWQKEMAQRQSEGRGGGGEGGETVQVQERGKEKRVVEQEKPEEVVAELRRKIAAIQVAGDEVTRRMYAEVMHDVRQRLDAVVSEAHTWQYQRGGR